MITAPPELTVTPARLTEVLRAAGATTAGVRQVESRPLDVAGAVGELVRLTLTYEPGEAPGPATIVAKGPGRTDTQRAMDQALGLFARERAVYSELSNEIPLGLPRLYYAGAGDGTEPMLIEDLRHHRAGDQVTGLTLADAERLVDRLADTHARFWETKPPGGDATRLITWTDPTIAGMLTQLVTSGVGALRERYAGRVPAKTLDTIERIAPDWATVLNRCADGPQTFVHNDFRLDNIFFDPDGEPIVIDWQLAGRCRGTQDLAYLLSGSMATVELTASWEQLVERYHARLIASGVAGYDREQCRFHYRQSLLYTLAPGIAMLGQMALAGGDKRGLADTLVLRTLTHATDLNALDTL